MNERMGESLSALMDGEANELELQRLMNAVESDPELRQTWARYHAVRSAITGQELLHPAVDISSRVQEAIALEGDNVSTLQKVMKPLASFAVAASVTAVVVLGGGQLAQIGDAGSYNGGQSVASNHSPIGIINGMGAASVPASFDTRSVRMLEPASHTAYQELARQRMQKYLQEHAEQAALNSPQGLVPFARVKEIKE